MHEQPDNDVYVVDMHHTIKSCENLMEVDAIIKKNFNDNFLNKLQLKIIEKKFSLKI